MKLKRRLWLSKTCLHLLSGSVMRSHFSSFLLLHSNSQMANVLSSPAQNSPGIPTSKPFTAFGSVNRGLSDTWEEAVNPSMLFEKQWHMAEESGHRLTFLDHTLINIIPVQTLSYFTLYEAWNGQVALVIQWRHSQRKRERQPILFTPLQTTNYAHIVKTHQITMHNEACSRRF